MDPVEETIQRILGGDSEAFNLLVRDWQGRVYNLAWRFLGNRDDAQDVVQDTFLSVFQSLRRLRDPKSFPTWIYRITLNHCRGRWRARQPEVSLDDPDASSDPRLEKAMSVQDAVRENAGDKVEIMDLIRKCLSGMSDEHRTAIILKEYMGLSLEELASVMDCPLSTAKSRLYHGLRGVQRNLKRLL